MLGGIFSQSSLQMGANAAFLVESCRVARREMLLLVFAVNKSRLDDPLPGTQVYHYVMLNEVKHL